MTNANGACGPERVRVQVLCLCRAFACVAAILAPASVTAQSLPSGWTVSNIGRPALAGGAETASCVSLPDPCDGVKIVAAGADIWDSRDQFVFVHSPLSGDGSVIARVDALKETDPWAKAGVMVRESLSASARHALSLVSAQSGVAFQRRRESGGPSVHTGGSRRRAPVWVRLDRKGSTLSAYESADGVSWALVGRETLALPATVYVGVAVTSHDELAYTTARVSGLTVLRGGALPEGWSSRDIGAPPIAGSAGYAGGRFTLVGSGADIWNTSDQFRYAFRSVTGDVDLVARVDGITAGDPWSKAGIMIRSSLTGNAPHASLFMSLGHGLAFQRRLAAGAQTLHTDAGDRAAPVWLKLERRGVAITAFTSSDGTTWRLVGTDLFDLPSTFYAGLAITSHDPAAVALATFDAVTVRQVAAAAPLPVDGTEEPAESESPATSTDRSVLVFEPSPDHADVTGYTFEVALAATPSIALLRQALGKPAIVSGECAVDVSALLRLLPAGSYVGTVRAFNAAGTSPGASTPFVR